MYDHITTTDMRVWIGCMACLNAGDLRGAWYPATEAVEVTAEVLHHGPTSHGEVWCYDIDGLPISGECSTVQAAGLAEHIEEVPEWQRGAFVAWIQSGDYIVDGDDLPIVSEFEERYAGEWSDFEDFAEEMFTEFGYEAEVPEHLRQYIDMDRWANDLGHDYWTETAASGVYVFRHL